MNCKISSAIIVMLISAAVSVHAQDSDRAMVMEGELLKGNAESAQSIINAIDQKILSKEDQGYIACVQQRFSQEPVRDETLPPFVSEVLYAYQKYWYKAAKDPKSIRQYEAELQQFLIENLNESTDADLDTLTSKLKGRLAKEGFFSITGTTPPFQELMMWKQQTTQGFNVQLPEQTYAPKVVLLDNFVSLGWTAWMTCDRRATGGWATDTTLYSVMPRYKGGVQSNQFIAVLLTHETQHFADKNTFRDLKPWELEYRAKLAELWAADQTIAHDRIKKFMASQSEDENIPHSYANLLVVKRLTEKLKGVLLDKKIEEIHTASLVLLKEDTASRLSTNKP